MTVYASLLEVASATYTASDAAEDGVPTVNALLNLVQLAVLLALLKYVRGNGGPPG